MSRSGSGPPKDRSRVESYLIDRHPLLDAEFVDPFAQRGAGHAEELGGLDLVAGSLGQRADDKLAFGRRQQLELFVLARKIEKCLDRLAQRRLSRFG